MACAPASYLGGTACAPCDISATAHRTDPRRGDTDGDFVSDFDEVFGFPTGAGELALNPSDQANGGDKCAWRAQATLTVQ